uniref:Reverse transcriptase zinc-binding domain-containing protein n=1 Tax=Fagus sylvatica TaxID=28930 RepID=A0A2N9FL37_FAGSY
MGDSHKFHLVKWTKICEPIRKWWFGSQNLRRFNQALLEKWLWWYGTEWEALWWQVVEVKYGSLLGGWCSEVVRGPYVVSLSKNIRRGWDSFCLFCPLLWEMGVWCGFGMICGVRKVKELIEGWHVGLPRQRQSGIWTAIPHCHVVSMAGEKFEDF